MIHDWYRVSIMCGYKLIHVRSVPSDLPVVSTTIKQTLNWTDYNLTGRKDMKVFGKRVFFRIEPESHLSQNEVEYADKVICKRFLLK